METLEEENFGVSISSPSDAEFDAVVGYLEDIIMDDDFQLIQRNFMDKYYLEFDDTEENKLIYTPIFNEYICLVEKYIEEKLLDRIPGFSMSAFILTLHFGARGSGLRQRAKNQVPIASCSLDDCWSFPCYGVLPGWKIYKFSVTSLLEDQGQHKDEIAGDIFDMLLTFTDFLAFKEMFLDYKAEKEGRGLDLSSGLVVTPLSKASMSASQNMLRY